jgi:hypothetical protein
MSTAQNWAEKEHFAVLQPLLHLLLRFGSGRIRALDDSTSDFDSGDSDSGGSDSGTSDSAGSDSGSSGSRGAEADSSIGSSDDGTGGRRRRGRLVRPDSPADPDTLSPDEYRDIPLQ